MFHPQTRIMQLKITKPMLIEFLKYIALACLLVIGTFPENDWSFGDGIDPPLAWVFNHMFETGLGMGKHIIFPHGPLAFFMYPLQPNVFIAIVVTCFLKFLLLYNMVKLLQCFGKTKWLTAFLVSFGIAILATFSHLVVINILLLLLNYFNSQKVYDKVIAFGLTAFAFYIKSNIAVISGVICFSFLIYFFYQEKNYKKLGSDLLVLLGFLLILWLLMYHTFTGFVNYFVGMYHLAQDNSSAASYYPYNNWWTLTGFIAICLVLPWLNRTRKSYFFWVLITLSLFAVWKYGLAREDIFHYRWFLVYTILILLSFVFFEPTNVSRNLILSFLAIVFLTINMSILDGYVPARYSLFKAGNFYEYLTDRDNLKQKAEEETQSQTSKNILPKVITDVIKSDPVDVYPWDYSIISVNHLNWQPRVVLHSYASYTHWLDEKNAIHFNSSQAPKYLILQSLEWGGLNGGNLNSIDHRYFLNDEPLTIIQILRNYEPFYKDNQFFIASKRVTPLKIENSEIGNCQSRLETWIPVPENKQGLLRAKVKFSKSLMERVKSFLYKDEQFFVYLRMNNGLIFKHRIVPKNAEDGIWINPYILNTYNGVANHEIESIMFKCSNEAIMNDNLGLTWERIDFKNYPDLIYQFFGKTKGPVEKALTSSENSFEREDLTYWTKPTNQDIVASEHYSGSHSFLLKPNSFSATYSFNLDSLPFGDIQIAVDCWGKMKGYKYNKKISVVISVENSQGNILYHATSLDDQLIDVNRWNQLFAFTNYNHNKQNCILKVYVWNISKYDFNLDDFKVMIFKGKL